MKLSVRNNGDVNKILAEAQGKDRVYIVYEPKYKKGDVIFAEVDESGFYEIRLEDTLPLTLVYIDKKEAKFPIPFGVYRAGFSPRAFSGKRHFIEIKKANPADVQKRRNLAFNPHDGGENIGIYPHMTSNVTYEDSFRNKIFPDKGLFAPRNVIDGILANESHRLYPHHSWGINRNREAYLTCDFKRPVNVDTLKLYLRGEWPHDSYWTEVTVRCSDGSEAVLHLEKTLEGQEFSFVRKGITSLTLCNLKKDTDQSEFPALSLMEIWGEEISNGN